MCDGRSPARKEQALEREIVGLAAAAGEDDLIGVATEELRDLAARASERSLALVPRAQCPLDGLP